MARHEPPPMENNPSILTAHQETIKRETARRLRQTPTPAEHLLWQHLRASRLDRTRFYRQQVIDGFIADFYCHAARLVIEVDGPVHLAQTAYDTERTAILSRRGLRILRFTNTAVCTDIYAVIKTIRAALPPREATPSPALGKSLPRLRETQPSPPLKRRGA